MTVQLPTLTLAQQQQVLTDIQTKAFFPYSFLVNRLMTNAHFPNSGGGGRYLTFTYTPPSTIGLMAIAVNLFQIASSTLYNTVAQVSYAPTLNLTDGTTDTGNIIYTGNFQNINSNDYDKFSPGDYYVQTNNSLYIFFWVESAGIGSGNTFVGTVTLHTVPTGRQS